MIFGDKLVDWDFRMSGNSALMPGIRTPSLTVCLENFRLPLRDAIDPASVDLMASAEKALPARDGVGADDRAVIRVRPFDLVTKVGKRTARP
jgi:hypothetical protein